MPGLCLLSLARKEIQVFLAKISTLKKALFSFLQAHLAKNTVEIGILINNKSLMFTCF